MRCPRAALCVIAVVTALVLGPTAAPATAAGVLEVEVVGGGPVFDTSSFYPGARVSSVVRVANVGSEDGGLSVRSAGVVDEDRCSPVEVRAEMPCGSGRGDLGEQVELSIGLVADDVEEQVWQGSVYDLADGVVLAGALPAGGDPVAFLFSAHLPVSSGNETQMDLLRFDLRFDLDGRESAQVAGMSLGSPARTPGTSFLGVTLPVTGRPLAALLAGAALLVISGTAATAGARGLRSA